MNDWNFLVREVGRGRCAGTKSRNYRSVARGWKKVMETGSRVAHALEIYATLILAFRKYCKI